MKLFGMLIRLTSLRAANNTAETLKNFPACNLKESKLVIFNIVAFINNLDDRMFQLNSLIKTIKCSFVIFKCMKYPPYHTNATVTGFTLQLQFFNVTRYPEPLGWTLKLLMVRIKARGLRLWIALTVSKPRAFKQIYIYLDRESMLKPKSIF